MQRIIRRFPLSLLFTPLIHSFSHSLFSFTFFFLFFTRSFILSLSGRERVPLSEQVRVGYRFDRRVTSDKSRSRMSYRSLPEPIVIRSKLSLTALTPSRSLSSPLQFRLNQDSKRCVLKIGEHPFPKNVSYRGLEAFH